MFFRFISYQWEGLYYHYLPSSCAGCHAEGQEFNPRLDLNKNVSGILSCKNSPVNTLKARLGSEIGYSALSGLKSHHQIMRQAIWSFKTPSPGNPRAFDHCRCPGGGKFKPCLGGVGSLKRKCLVLLAHYTCEVLIRIYFTNSAMLCTALSI